MNWFSENKFLAVFGGVMVAGVGALGYLTYSASDEYSTAQQEYEAAKSELSGLNNNKPSLMPENLDDYKKRQKALKEQIDTFQRDLDAIEIKVEPISPTGFQDKLKEAVARILARANEMESPLQDKDNKEKFYLGFGEYQNTPPKDAAAPLLLRELKAIEVLINLLLDAKHVEIKRLVRTDLDEEKKAAEAPKNEKGAKKAEEQKKLIQKMTFEIEFATTQNHFQKVLNNLASNKTQFFIVRNLKVKNEKETAPTKNNPVAPVIAPVVDPANAPATPAKGPDREIIFGKEKVIVTMEVDILDFAEVDAATKKQPK